MEDDIEDFIGFYPGSGFWVGARVDLFDEESSYRLAGMIPEISVRMDSDRFSAVVCVDGLTLLRMRGHAAAIPDMGDPAQFETAIKWWEQHIDYANAVQIFLESESIKCQKSGEIVSSEVTIGSTCRVGFKGGIPVRKKLSNGRSLLSSRAEAANWIRGNREGPPPIETVNDGWSTWLVVTENAVVAALDKFERASADPLLIKRLSFVAKAKSAFSRGDFRVAFTLLWFVIESAARDTWREVVSAGQGGRKRENAKDIFNGLSDVGKISAAHLLLLHDLRRRVRNRLVHESESASCMPNDCLLAGRAAIDLAITDASLDLQTAWKTSVEF